MSNNQTSPAQTQAKAAKKAAEVPPVETPMETPDEANPPKDAPDDTPGEAPEEVSKETDTDDAPGEAPGDGVSSEVPGDGDSSDYSLEVDVAPGVRMGGLLILGLVKVEKKDTMVFITPWEPDLVYAIQNGLPEGFGSPMSYREWQEFKSRKGIRLALQLIGSSESQPDLVIPTGVEINHPSILKKMKGEIINLISKNQALLGYYGNAISEPVWASIDRWVLKAVNPQWSEEKLSAEANGNRRRNIAATLSVAGLIQAENTLNSALKQKLALR